MVCVGNDDDLRQVCTGDDGAFAGMAPGAILVDHTTVSAAVTRELSAQADAAGLGFVDAPVSGGQAGAENGQLSIMCGGPQDQYDRAEPVMAAYARICRRMGDSGAGQLAKMCNQICIAGLVQGLSESLNFAAAAGSVGARPGRGHQPGAAGSWQMQNRHQTMDAKTASTSVSPWTGCARTWASALIPRTGSASACRSPPWWTSSTRTCSRMGGGRWDTSSLIARLRPPARR